MRKNTVLIQTLCLLVGVLPLLGFLPPDAEHRTQEFIQTRQRQRAAYAARQEARWKKREAENKRYRREMQYPPWRRSEEAMVAVESGRGAARASVFKREQRKHGWFFGLLGLLAIGGATWWIKCLTEDESKGTIPKNIHLR